MAWELYFSILLSILRKDEIAELIVRATGAGQYMDDPNFPGDPDKRLYMITTEVSSRAERIVSDELTTTGAVETDPENAAELHDHLIGADQSIESGLVNTLVPRSHPTGLAIKGGMTGKNKGKGNAKGKIKSKGKGKGKGKNPDEVEPTSCIRKVLTRPSMRLRKSL